VTEPPISPAEPGRADDEEAVAVVERDEGVRSVTEARGHGAGDDANDVAGGRLRLLEGEVAADALAGELELDAGAGDAEVRPAATSMLRLWPPTVNVSATCSSVV